MISCGMWWNFIFLIPDFGVSADSGCKIFAYTQNSVKASTLKHKAVQSFCQCGRIIKLKGSLRDFHF